MNREEPMKNLWTKSHRIGKGGFIHNPSLGSGVFTPIWKECQRFDPFGHFEVIPLPTVSY
jgi:hypothetical protein